MVIHMLPVGPIRANCYLVRADDARQGVLIDPGADAGSIIAECQAMGMVPAAILLTHGHFDHTGAVEDLLRQWPGTPVYFHKGDAADDPRAQLAWHPVPSTVYYDEGDSLTLAGLPFHVLHTPGHSPGSVVLRCGSALFTGDTLFRGSMGRTDFPGGSDAQMMASLKRLGSLEGDYQVYPGHDSPTTLAEERRTNYFLKGAMAR